MGTAIDLDAAREARAEVEGDRHFIFKGERYDLPDELPYSVLGPIGMLVENESNLLALRSTMVALLGPETHERFEAARPSIADLNALVAGIFDDYGLGTPAQNGASGELDPKSEPS